MRGIKALKYLKYLNIAFKSKEIINDLTCYHIAVGCPQLETLSLEIPDLTAGGLMIILKGIKFLIHILLKGCQFSTDMSVIHMAENQPNLLTIYLSGCTRLGNLSLNSIADSCKQLKNININFCEKLSTEKSH